jgi:hypothetical protein
MSCPLNEGRLGHGSNLAFCIAACLIVRTLQRIFDHRPVLKGQASGIGGRVLPATATVIVCSSSTSPS